MFGGMCRQPCPFLARSSCVFVLARCVLMGWSFLCYHIKADTVVRQKPYVYGDYAVICLRCVSAFALFMSKLWHHQDLIWQSAAIVVHQDLKALYNI